MGWWNPRAFFRDVGRQLGFAERKVSGFGRWVGNLPRGIVHNVAYASFDELGSTLVNFSGQFGQVIPNALNPTLMTTLPAAGYGLGTGLAGLGGGLGQGIGGLGGGAGAGIQGLLTGTGKGVGGAFRGALVPILVVGGLAIAGLIAYAFIKR